MPSRDRCFGDFSQKLLMFLHYWIFLQQINGKQVLELEFPLKRLKNFNKLLIFRVDMDLSFPIRSKIKPGLSKMILLRHQTFWYVGAGSKKEERASKCNALLWPGDDLFWDENY